MNIQIIQGNEKHAIYAEEICQLIEESAKVRGTGIAKREPEYIRTKFRNENAIIALDGDQLVGFCYIEIFQNKKYVSNSGLIVKEAYRKYGIAKEIKKKAFSLAREKYPQARIFGITTSLAVMKINSELGYKPVTFSELTQDEAFWKGCQSCPNYDILNRNNMKMCLCTGMLAPSKEDEMKFNLTNKIVTNVEK
ncbi:GNAT family N-acetyltransferase [Membranihabitans maritimus]|uniref:GNAT family N-acetyltransferase n=1 Tax=Membranihabitans maritimus TaxID=2904244 RepID=UPI001F02BC13|nr:GNAT family N-acetyltransferase [Membranihabitans maritimus]